MMKEVDSTNVGNSGFKSSSAVSQKVERRDVWGLTSPTRYHETYRSLTKMDDENWVGTVFSDGVRNHLNPMVDRKSRTLLTGSKSLESFDPAAMEFLDELVTIANKEIPVDKDDELFSRTGVATDFSKLRCPAGYMQSPMSAKVLDNTRLRAELGLTEGYSARQKQIAEDVWDEVWSHSRPSNVNVPKASDGGMPRFSKDRQWKLDFALWKTQPDNYARFIRMVERADVYGLANSYECVWAMNTQKRLQLDEIGKERPVNDWEYAMSSGARGSRKPADKHVSITWDGVTRDWPEFSAMRVRVIDAGPWSINCDLQIVATGAMRAMFHRFGRTFHVNTKEQITDNIQGRYIFCSDVSEYDQSMSGDALKPVFSCMRKHYPEGIVRSAERLYQSPYYARPLEMDGKRGRWAGNPFDWTKSLNAGNRSGHAFTSLVAKVNKVIETLFLIDHIYPVTKANLRLFLTGAMPMGIVNNGDDEIVWALEKRDLTKFKAFRADLKLGHYVVTPEVGQGYSGMLMVRPDPSLPHYVPTARIHTSIEKCYVPERSVGGFMRPYWAIGFYDRIDALHQSDNGRHLWDIHNHSYSKHLEPKIGKLSSILDYAYKQHSVDMHALTIVDREVLADPDKLHYKYGEEDVSPGVLDLLTTKIPKHYCEAFLKEWFTGNFI